MHFLHNGKFGLGSERLTTAMSLLETVENVYGYWWFNEKAVVRIFVNQSKNKINGSDTEGCFDHPGCLY